MSANWFWKAYLKCCCAAHRRRRQTASGALLLIGLPVRVLDSLFVDGITMLVLYPKTGVKLHVGDELRLGLTYLVVVDV